MPEIERKEKHLYYLTQESNENEVARNFDRMADEIHVMIQERPLNSNRVRKVIKREEWENLSEDIRSFR